MSTARPGTWRRRLRVLGLSSLSLLGLLLAAELVVRWTSDVPFLGTSAELFVEGRFGSSRGNRARSTAVAFGERAFLDRDGFRVPAADYVYPDGPALLLIGDSVTFGPGVPEPETFAGRLRSARPGLRVLNAGVIGHDLADALNVVRTLLSEREDVRQAVLVYCLNDLSPASAAKIERALGHDDADPAQRPVLGASWAERLRSIPLLADANALLRERSKLYLLLRNRLSDPPRLYFQADRELYAGPEPAVFARLEPLAEIARLLADARVAFHVVVSPYAYQVRAPSPETLLPQRRVLEYLAAHAIPASDAIETLRAVGESAFLAYDPMHLSAAGHAAMARLIEGLLVP